MTENKEIKEICDDLLLKVNKLNKLDLLYGSIHAAHDNGYLNEQEANALYKHLQKTAHLCGIELLIPKK